MTVIIFVLRRNQFESLNEKNKQTKQNNSIKLYTLSGTGIKTSHGLQGMHYCKRYKPGKYNRDVSKIQQLILTMEFSLVISTLTVTSFNSTTN